jgi:transcriptional regulator with XRE-family HTH domain
MDNGMDIDMHADETSAGMPLRPKIPGKLIRRLRRMQDLSARDLAKLVGTSQQTINKLERGVSGESKFFAPIGELLGITPEMAAAEPAPPPARFPEEVGEIADEPPKHEPSRKLEFEHRPTLPLYPNLGRVSVGTYLLFKCPTCKILRPAMSMLRHAKEAYAWIMPDNSMSPEYESGDTLIADPEEPPRVGRSHIFRNRYDKNCDNAKVLRLVAIKDQHYLVKSHCGDNDGDGGKDRLPINIWKAHLIKSHNIDLER